jgi:hypothetical protein
MVEAPNQALPGASGLRYQAPDPVLAVNPPESLEDPDHKDIRQTDEPSRRCVAAEDPDPATFTTILLNAAPEI